MVNYDFTQGYYRAKVKMTYKRDDMSMNDYIYSNAYIFQVINNPHDKRLRFRDTINGIYVNSTIGRLQESPMVYVRPSTKINITDTINGIKINTIGSINDSINTQVIPINNQIINDTINGIKVNTIGTIVDSTPVIEVIDVRPHHEYNVEVSDVINGIAVEVIGDITDTTPDVDVIRINNRSIEEDINGIKVNVLGRIHDSEPVIELNY